MSEDERAAARWRALRNAAAADYRHTGDPRARAQALAAHEMAALHGHEHDRD
jgi:hypothetical protein